MISLEVITEESKVTPDSTRKAGVKGKPFMLANGQFWDLATPALRIRPKFVNGRVELENRWDYPANVRKLAQELLELYVEGKEIPFDLIVNTAFQLVRLCHELSPEEAASLFEIPVEEVEDLAVAMLRMFRGDRPSEEQPEEEPEIIAKAE